MSGHSTGQYSLCCIDEDQSPEEEKAELEAEANKYKPLLNLIKEKATSIVKEGET